MEEISKLAQRNSCIISALYVGIGTIAVLCSYPPYYGDWVLFTLLITLPVSVVGFGVMYAGSQYYLIVLVVQLIMFLITWRVIYAYLRERYERKSKVDP